MKIHPNKRIAYVFIFHFLETFTSHLFIFMLHIIFFKVFEILLTYYIIYNLLNIVQNIIYSKMISINNGNEGNEGAINQIQPIHLLGMNSKFAFCAFIHQSIAYLSGCHLIIEETQTHQQTIIWTKSLHEKLHYITYYKDNYYNNWIILVVFARGRYKLVMFNIYIGIKRNNVKFINLYLEDIHEEEAIQSIKRCPNKTLILTQYKNRYKMYIFNNEGDQNLHIRHYDNFQHINLLNFNLVQCIVINDNNTLIVFSMQYKQLLRFQLKIGKIVDTQVDNENNLIFFLNDIGEIYQYKVNRTLTDCKKIDVTYEGSKPSTMLIHQNKIFITYHKNSIVGYLTYSDCSAPKIIYLNIFQDPTNMSANIQQILNIQISNDNFRGIFTVKTKNRYEIFIVDLVSVLVDNNFKCQYIHKTMSRFGCERVIDVKFLELYNLLLVFNQTSIKLYDLNNVCNYNVLLWQEKLKSQPLNISIHPFSFNMIITTKQSTKLYLYNHEKILYSVSLQCQIVTYSPLGEYIVIANYGSLIFIDSYTLELQKQIPITNKTILNIKFFNKWDMIIQMANNYILLIVNFQMVHIGVINHELNMIDYDANKDLFVVIRDEYLYVYKEAHEIGVIDKKISSMKLCIQLDFLLLGGKDGCLYIIQWSKRLNFIDLDNYFCLHDAPISHLEISPDFKYVYTISQNNICVSKIVQVEINRMRRNLSTILMYRNDRTFLKNKTLTFISEECKRNQQLSKLYNKETDSMTYNKNYIMKFKNKNNELLVQEEISLAKKIDEELQQFERLQQYEQLLRNIEYIKKQFHQLVSKDTTQKQKLNQLFINELNKIYQYRKQLEQKKNQIIISQKAKYLNNCNEYKIIEENENIKKSKQISTVYQFNQSIVNEKKHQQQLINLKFIDLEENYIDAKESQVQNISKKIEYYKERNNVLQSNIRKLNTQMNHFKQKNKQLYVKYTEMMSELHYVQYQEKQVNKQKDKLNSQVNNCNNKVNQLLKQSKQLENDLGCISNETKISSSYYEKLKELIEYMTKQDKNLQMKGKQYSMLLVDEFKKKTFFINQFKIKQEKIKKLKEKKKEKQNRKIIKKFRSHHTTLHNSPNKNFSSMSNENLSVYIDKVCFETQKYNEIKSSNLDKYKKFTNKIQAENIKLTDYYNLLKRNNQQFVTKIKQNKHKANSIIKSRLKQKPGTKHKLKRGFLCSSINSQQKKQA